MAEARSIQTGARAGDIVRFGLLALTVAWITAFHTPLAEPFVDLMQEGEYLAPRLFFLGGAHAHPLLIHGQIDYVPSQLAAAACTPGRLIACTRAVNLWLTMASGLLLFACAIAAGRTRQAAAAAALAVAVLLILTTGRDINVVDVSQSGAGVRDLWLYAAALCLILADRAPFRAATVLRLGAGSIAGLAMFWAYNRGLIGAVAILAYALAAVVTGRPRGRGLPAIAGFVIGLAILCLADPGMARQHAWNIAYWARHGEIWRYPFSAGRFLANLPAYGAVAAAVAVAAWLGWMRWQRDERRSALPSLAALAVICAAVAQQTLNRADENHVRMIFPWLLLLVLLAATRLRTGVSLGWPEIARRWWPLLVCLEVAALVDFYAARSIVRPMLQNGAVNASLLLHGLPGDDALASADERRVAVILARAHPACAYAMNNAGGLYHLAGRRPCSTIMHPVYAAADRQDRIIADLAAARPAVIVWSSPDYFSAIDGRSQAVRTPALVAWAERAYPHALKVGSIELRAR